MPGQLLSDHVPAGSTEQRGDYVLMVTGSGINTESGKPVTGIISTSWTNQSLFTRITEFAEVRTISVNSEVVSTHGALDLSNFTAADIGLTRSGDPVSTTESPRVIRPTTARS